MFKGLGNLANLGEMMKHASQMGARVQEVQERMKSLRVTGAGGGGMIQVEMTAAADGTLSSSDVQEAADRLAALADGIRQVRDVEAAVNRPTLQASDPTAPRVPQPRPAHPAPRPAKARGRRAQPH